MASSPIKTGAPSNTVGPNSRLRPSILSSSSSNSNTIKNRSNKFSVPSDSKFNFKSSKDGKDSVTNTPEFYLLNRLFLSSKYLIKNDSISIKKLSNHLPVIISRDASIQGSQLNLQLHLFLSSIVTEYVSSWYFTKLNTDNVEFIQLLYQVLCEFVRDLSTRVNAVLRPENIVKVIDEMSGIIDEHFSSLYADTDDRNDIKLFTEYNRYYETTNIARNKRKNEDTIIKNYLQANHIIFDSIISDGKEQEILYFRILAKKILTYSFHSAQEESLDLLNGVLDSKITMDLILSLLSELVLENLLNKLSSPRFLISTLIEGIVDKLNSHQLSESKNITTQQEITYKEKLKAMCKSTYYMGASFIVSLQKKGDNCDYQHPMILENSIFDLINTITHFSARRPILGCFLGVVRKACFNTASLSRRIDSVARRFISSKVLNSSSLNDENSAKIIEQLRIKLFDKTEDKDDTGSTVSDMGELTDKIYELLSGNNIQQRHLKSIYTFFLNENKNDEQGKKELKTAIRKFLMVLNFDNKSADNLMINERSSLNKLLVIKLLDCLIGNLYQEFT